MTSAPAGGLTAEPTSVIRSPCTSTSPGVIIFPLSISRSRAARSTTTCSDVGGTDCAHTREKRMQHTKNPNSIAEMEDSVLIILRIIPLALNGDEQILCECPLIVYPLRHALEPGPFSHLRGLVPPILVTALGPDGLIAFERGAEISPFDGDGLAFNRAEMHLDAPLPGVVERDVLKSGQVEVTSELPIDAGQQVAIEYRRHAERVVVGGNELGQGFFQVRAQQQRIARLERLANLAQEVVAGLA